jgi:hypothetical protein
MRARITKAVRQILSKQETSEGAACWRFGLCFGLSGRGFVGRIPGPALVGLASAQAVILRAFGPGSFGGLNAKGFMRGTCLARAPVRSAQTIESAEIRRVGMAQKPLDHFAGSLSMEAPIFGVSGEVPAFAGRFSAKGTHQVQPAQPGGEISSARKGPVFRKMNRPMTSIPLRGDERKGAFGELQETAPIGMRGVDEVAGNFRRRVIRLPDRLALMDCPAGLREVERSGGRRRSTSGKRDSQDEKAEQRRGRKWTRPENGWQSPLSRRARRVVGAVLRRDVPSAGHFFDHVA